ncbi:hypothetical protein HHK36_001449 [Tetracentron sinense]|uniref:Protein kinase domain-containing protein n=1 Tax=Tetracentron sinense TaxID=13715 RepID=A0A835DV10_TETSI|nr:hypothetical protein HHK36_001449 [Tetracentron sinense]
MDNIQSRMLAASLHGLFRAFLDSLLIAENHLSLSLSLLSYASPSHQYLSLYLLILLQSFKRVGVFIRSIGCQRSGSVVHVMTCFAFLFGRGTASAPKRTVEVDEEVSGIQNVNLYTYKELRIATEDFSAANKIGEGGFGSVYKGRLKDGIIAAIKVLSADSRQGVREFLTEINVISDIEHDNLVTLYGCCVEGNHRIVTPCMGILLLQTWALHERKELVELVDTSLNGDFDAEEACRFLEIGLLCTQDAPKLRPAMSTVVKMLTGEMDVDNENISKPGLISDFMDVKVKEQKTNPDMKNTSNTESSGSDKQDNSSLLSGDTTCATMSFTAICDRTN